jgi:hypothetical protein
VNAARRILVPTLVFCCFAWASNAHAAQKLKDADCLTCHGDSTLTTEENGKTVSLFVDQNKF